MVLGKLPVSGRPTYLDKSRARADCACSPSEWGGGCLVIFSLVCHFSPLCLSLGDGLIWTEIMSQKAAKLKTTNQLTNQPTLGQRKNSLSGWIPSILRKLVF